MYLETILILILSVLFSNFFQIKIFNFNFLQTTQKIFFNYIGQNMVIEFILLLILNIFFILKRFLKQLIEIILILW